MRQAGAFDLRRFAGPPNFPALNTSESKFVRRKVALPAAMIEQAEATHPGGEFHSEAEWLRCVKEEFPKFLPYLTKKCGVEFRGRLLEIGAGAAWFSAELSKLPLVVEIIATDVSASLLETEAPRLFKTLRAKAGKIIRTPMDFSALDFPDGHFDAVVCAEALHLAPNMRRVLREVRRVLKPGGVFVALREPIRSGSKTKTTATTPALRRQELLSRGHSLSEYRQSFESAGLKLTVKNVTLARGLRHYFARVMKGTAPARYAFIATKPMK